MDGPKQEVRFLVEALGNYNLALQIVLAGWVTHCVFFSSACDRYGPLWDDPPINGMVRRL